jgi:hypothetical protein
VSTEATALTTPHASFRSSKNLQRRDLENIVLKGSRYSLLVRVCDEDPVYVVGYHADIRNYVVDTNLVRIEKSEIALRLKVREELSPDPGELKFQ